MQGYEGSKTPLFDPTSLARFTSRYNGPAQILAIRLPVLRGIKSSCTASYRTNWGRASPVSGQLQKQRQIQGA